jgi:uncharacterized protein
MFRPIATSSLSFACTLALGLAMGTRAQAAPGVIPPLEHRVTDLAHMLQPQEAQDIDAHLQRVEQNQDVSIAVLTVPELQGEAIEAYSMRVAEAWKLGARGKDRGVLFLIAAQEHQVRLEVGYGLEGTLPDALCARLIAEKLRPTFSQKKYRQGIDDLVDALAMAAQDKPRTAVNGKTPKSVAKTFAPTKKVGIVFFVLLFHILLRILALCDLYRIERASWIAGGKHPIGKDVPTGAIDAKGFVYGWLLTMKVLSILGGSRRGFGGGAGGGGGYRGGGGGFGGGGASGGW